MIAKDSRVVVVGAGLMGTGIAHAFAASGFATAMVVNAAGNGVQLAYLLSSDAPTKLYYHANFLRSGEFAEGAHATLYRTPGGMSVVARGQPAEHVKFLFARPGATFIKAMGTTTVCTGYFAARPIQAANSNPAGNRYTPISSFQSSGRA